jgi:hypothetical protein
MCRRVSCSDCGKPTFKGCGDHVEQVLGGIPADERCRCREEARRRAAESLATPTADAA